MIEEIGPRVQFSVEGWRLFWQYMAASGSNIAIYILGILFGGGIEVGVYYGSYYPCLGQAFDLFSSLYYGVMYMVYLMGGGMDTVALFYVFFDLMELFVAISADWCAKGFLFTWSDLSNGEVNSYHTPASIALEETK